MKNFVFTFIAGFFGIFAWKCQSGKIPLKQNDFRPIVLKKTVDTSDTFIVEKQVRIFPEKDLKFKKDPTGKHYVVMENNPRKTVFQISYLIKAPKNIADGNMEHSLYFSTDNPVGSGSWKDAGLRKIKATYGFYAFHPQSGIKPVTKGKISLKTHEKYKTVEIQVALEGIEKNLNGTYLINLGEFERKE